MMPDLGKYAEAVLSSYVVSLVLLGALVAMSLRRGRQARRALEVAEGEKRKNG